jgi:prepilin-type N-terminal cleavage/methylation domain-containing protein
MKTSGAKSNRSGLTLIELLVVICVVAIFVAMLLPANTGPRKARMPWCMNNQKQIALSLMMFQDDHNDKFPWQEPSTNGGSLELASSNQAFPHFRALSGYFGKQTRIFVCPTDTARQPATNYSEIANTNISYFLNFDAATNVNSIWTGDRYLESNGTLIRPGVFIQTTNVALAWADGLHKFQNKPVGICSFGDGHVQTVRGDQLNSFLQKQPLATNRFCVP